MAVLMVRTKFQWWWLYLTGTPHPSEVFDYTSQYVNESSEVGPHMLVFGLATKARWRLSPSGSGVLFLTPTAPCLPHRVLQRVMLGIRYEIREVGNDSN